MQCQAGDINNKPLSKPDKWVPAECEAPDKDANSSQYNITYSDS